MHILLALLGIAAAGAFWWYRLKMMNDAAGEVVDAVGRVRGNLRRKKIRQHNELSPLTAIDDPVVAAATLLVAIASDDAALGPNRESAARAEIALIADPAKLEEAIVYAKWASGQIDDAGTVIDNFPKGPTPNGWTQARRADVEGYTLLDPRGELVFSYRIDGETCVVDLNLYQKNGSPAVHGGQGGLVVEVPILFGRRRPD